MKLLTQEEGKNLKSGDRVNVHWFTPRCKKGEVPPSRHFDGREEWLESVWLDETVAEAPYLTVSDGWAVKLARRHGFYCVSRLSKSRG